MNRSEKARYVPAAGFKFLTRLYDPLVRITCREIYFKKRMLEVADIKPGESLLDVGCGTGTLLLQFHSQTNHTQLHGLDGDPDILNIARQKADTAHASINWIHAYSTNIPLENNSMALVTNSLMIHHLVPEEKLATFREMYRVLKPGGKLILVDWGKPSNLIFKGLFQFIRILDGFENTKAHQTGELPMLLKHAGFEDVMVVEKINTIFGTLDLITATKSNH